MAAALGARRRGSVSACSTSKIAADPELLRRVRVDMYRRIGYYPTETSEHSSEYVAWYLKHADEIERLRIEPGMYVGISEDNVATYERTKAQLAAGEQIELESSQPSTPRRSCTAW